MLSKIPNAAVMVPSGSGKSTLKSIIGGIEPPTSGQVILDGVDIANLSDDQRTVLRRRKIGFVFQAGNYYSNKSRMTLAFVTSASVKLASRPSCGYVS